MKKILFGFLLISCASFAQVVPAKVDTIKVSEFQLKQIVELDTQAKKLQEQLTLLNQMQLLTLSLVLDSKGLKPEDFEIVGFNDGKILIRKRQAK